MLLWRVAGVVSGDALFHLARVRKLDELGDLHLRTVDEFTDGGLHPGYAFPLWHGFLALVAKLSGLDPSVVVSHEASLLAPLACLVAWEAGVAVFGSRGGRARGARRRQLGLYCFAAGHGGVVRVARAAGDGGAAAARAGGDRALLRLRRVEAVGRLAAALAAAFGALALVHPTYALFALIPLAALRASCGSREWRALGDRARRGGRADGARRALAAGRSCDETRSHDPDATRERARARAVRGPARRSGRSTASGSSPELVGRSGASRSRRSRSSRSRRSPPRRRWSAFVLGGTVSILALMLVPTLFARFSDVVSLSQSRRAAGLRPVRVRVRRRARAARAARWLVLPVALVAGIVLQLLWPGDFGYGLRHGGPAVVTWFAFVGGAVGARRSGSASARRDDRASGTGRAAVAALPLRAAGRRARLPPLDARCVPRDPHALSPAARRASCGECRRARS